MFDSTRREIHYLRLSVTDLCNLRCRYCMPDGVEKLEREAVLTYEEFLQTHARHYALPNSYTVLYGDVDIERELAFIDKRFAEACRRDAGAPNPLTLQAPVAPERRVIRMATAESNAEVGASYVIGTAADRARMLSILGHLVCVKTPEGNMVTGYIANLSETSDDFFSTYGFDVAQADVKEAIDIDEA